MHVPVSPGACGILAVFDPESPVSGAEVLDAIGCISYRGSNLGAGFSYFEDTDRVTLQAFASSMRALHRARGFIPRHWEIEFERALHLRGVSGNTFLWEMSVVTDDGEAEIENRVEAINSLLSPEKGEWARFVGVGRGLHVVKGIGFPSDVAGSVPGFTSIKSDTWLAHTRQPTNSPGSYPIFSHPFSSVNISAVHNGDVSSFGANVNALRNLGYRSFVGTDSEVIVRLLFVLMHRFRMPAEEALQVLAGTHPLSNEFPGLSLDGPFSVAFSFMEGGMRKIAAVADRSKLRPLLVGTDGGRVVVASELNQVKRLIGNPEVRRLKGGEVMVADRHGIRYC